MQRAILILGITVMILFWQNCSKVNFSPDTTSATSKAQSVDSSIAEPNDETAVREDEMADPDEIQEFVGARDKEDNICLGGGVKVLATNTVNCADVGVVSSGHGGRCVYVCVDMATLVLSSNDARRALATGGKEGQCNL